MKNFTKKIVAAHLLVISMISFNTAIAHGGGHAVNGGIVEVVGDVALELVVLDDAVHLYMVDDGVEISVEGMSAKLVIESGDVKSELTLAPASRNQFTIQGQTIASESKVTAVVVRKDGYSKIIVNFLVE